MESRANYPTIATNPTQLAVLFKQLGANFSIEEQKSGNPLLTKLAY